MFLVVYYLKDEVTIRAAYVAGATVDEMIDNLCLDDPEVTSVDQIVALQHSADEAKRDGLRVKRMKDRKVGHLSVIVESVGSVYEGHNAKAATDAYLDWAMKSREGKEGVGGKRVVMLDNGMPLQHWAPRTRH